MSDLDDVLSGKEPDPIENQPEEQPQAEAPETLDEPQAETPDEAPQEAPKEEAKQDNMVPASVVAELRQQLRELKQSQQPQRPPPQVPDVLDSPQEYARFMQSQSQQLAQNVKLDISEEMARTTHGDDVVDAAFQSLQAAKDAAAWQKIVQARHPWNELVKWHKQQQVFSEVGDDPTGWMEKQREAIRAEVEAELAAKQIRDAAGQRAPSLANATGKGGNQSAKWDGPVDLDDLLG
jgi:hypothetical protein